MHLTELVQHLLPSFGYTGDLTYWVAFLAALGESLAFVGTLIPGSTIIMVAGFAAAQGAIDATELVWFVAIGAIIGDALSYYLGTKGTRFFHDENKLLKANYIRRGEDFFRKHGTKSVFFGRFVPPLRAIIPFIAGLSGMSFRVFLFWNVVSAFVWAAVMVALGYFFGHAYRTIEQWTGRSLAILIGGLILGYLLWHSAKRAQPYAMTLAAVIKRRLKDRYADTAH